MPTAAIGATLEKRSPAGMWKDRPGMPPEQTPCRVRDRIRLGRAHP